MNKIIIVIAIIGFLAFSGFLMVKKQSTQTNNQPPLINSTTENSTSASITPKAINTTTNPVSTYTKNELDAELEKELNQLDKDISTGSKDSLTDSDFDF